MGAPLATKTLELLERVERGDREAAYDLARIYRPDDVTEFVEFVQTQGPISTWLFDVLADAYNAYVGG